MLRCLPLPRSVLCLLFHGYSLARLVWDERPISFRGEDEEQLWRFFYRRCGMGRLEMKQVRQLCCEGGVKPDKSVCWGLKGEQLGAAGDEAGASMQPCRSTGFRCRDCQGLDTGCAWLPATPVPLLHTRQVCAASCLLHTPPPAAGAAVWPMGAGARRAGNHGWDRCAPGEVGQPAVRR